MSGRGRRNSTIDDKHDDKIDAGGGPNLISIFYFSDQYLQFQQFLASFSQRESDWNVPQRGFVPSCFHRLKYAFPLLSSKTKYVKYTILVLWSLLLHLLMCKWSPSFAAYVRQQLLNEGKRARLEQGSPCQFSLLLGSRVTLCLAGSLLKVHALEI